VAIGGYKLDSSRVYINVALLAQSPLVFTPTQSEMNAAAAGIAWGLHTSLRAIKLASEMGTGVP